MSQPLTVTTKLEAVNTMLQAVGSTPVSSLTVSVDADVTNALAVLHETSKEVQSQGWDFNTDTRYSMARTIEGHYLVPDNMLACDVSEWHPAVRATYRAGKLWDQRKHTFVWDVDLTFNVTWFFAFEELPEAARHYITMKAARKFQARVLGSSSLGKFTEQDELEARSIFIDAEALDANHNIITGSESTARVIHRRV